jgi:hypothetical protein
MGADFIVHRACEPKRALGEGDALEGTKAMLEMLKAHNRAELLAANAGGRDPRSLRLKVVRTGSGGAVEQEVSYGELRAAAASLHAHAGSCGGCPANVSGNPFGCFGAVAYPVTAVAERWMVDRLQPADRPGGSLLLDAIHDFRYDGAPIREMRARGLFELQRAAEKTVRKKLLHSIRVTGDQLFQAFFSVGGALGPSHCALLLTFLGALELDGRVPETPGDGGLLLAAMQAAPGDARRRLARLSLGTPRPELQPMHELLRAAYTAWVLEVELLMDA